MAEFHAPSPGPRGPEAAGRACGQRGIGRVRSPPLPPRSTGQRQRQRRPVTPHPQQEEEGLPDYLEKNEPVYDVRDCPVDLETVALGAGQEGGRALPLGAGCPCGTREGWRGFARPFQSPLRRPLRRQRLPSCWAPASLSCVPGGGRGGAGSSCHAPSPPPRTTPPGAARRRRPTGQRPRAPRARQAVLRSPSSLRGAAPPWRALPTRLGPLSSHDARHDDGWQAVIVIRPPWGRPHGMAPISTFVHPQAVVCCRVCRDGATVNTVTDSSSQTPVRSSPSPSGIPCSPLSLLSRALSLSSDPAPPDVWAPRARASSVGCSVAQATIRHLTRGRGVQSVMQRLRWARGVQALPVGAGKREPFGRNSWGCREAVVNRKALPGRKNAAGRLPQLAKCLGGIGGGGATIWQPG